MNTRKRRNVDLSADAADYTPSTAAIKKLKHDLAAPSSSQQQQQAKHHSLAVAKGKKHKDAVPTKKNDGKGFAKSSLPAVFRTGTVGRPKLLKNHPHLAAILSQPPTIAIADIKTPPPTASKPSSAKAAKASPSETPVQAATHRSLPTPLPSPTSANTTTTPPTAPPALAAPKKRGPGRPAWRWQKYPPQPPTEAQQPPTAIATTAHASPVSTSPSHSHRGASQMTPPTTPPPASSGRPLTKKGQSSTRQSKPTGALAAAYTHDIATNKEAVVTARPRRRVTAGRRKINDDSSDSLLDDEDEEEDDDEEEKDDEMAGVKAHKEEDEEAETASFQTPCSSSDRSEKMVIKTVLALDDEEDDDVSSTTSLSSSSITSFGDLELLGLAKAAAAEEDDEEEEEEEDDDDLPLLRRRHPLQRRRGGGVNIDAWRSNVAPGMEGQKRLKMGETSMLVNTTPTMDEEMIFRAAAEEREQEAKELAARFAHDLAVLVESREKKQEAEEEEEKAKKQRAAQRLAEDSAAAAAAAEAKDQAHPTEGAKCIKAFKKTYDAVEVAFQEWKLLEALQEMEDRRMPTRTTRHRASSMCSSVGSGSASTFPLHLAAGSDTASVITEKDKPAKALSPLTPSSPVLAATAPTVTASASAQGRRKLVPPPLEPISLVVPSLGKTQQGKEERSSLEEDVLMHFDVLTNEKSSEGPPKMTSPSGKSTAMVNANAPPKEKTKRGKLQERRMKEAKQGATESLSISTRQRPEPTEQPNASLLTTAVAEITTPAAPPPKFIGCGGLLADWRREIGGIYGLASPLVVDDPPSRCTSRASSPLHATPLSLSPKKKKQEDLLQDGEALPRRKTTVSTLTIGADPDLAYLMSRTPHRYSVQGDDDDNTKEGLLTARETNQAELDAIDQELSYVYQQMKKKQSGHLYANASEASSSSKEKGAMAEAEEEEMDLDLVDDHLSIISSSSTLCNTFSRDRQADDDEEEEEEEEEDDEEEDENINAKKSAKEKRNTVKEKVKRKEMHRPLRSIGVGDGNAADLYVDEDVDDDDDDDDSSSSCSSTSSSSTSSISTSSDSSNSSSSSDSETGKGKRSHFLTAAQNAAQTYRPRPMEDIGAGQREESMLWTDLYRSSLDASPHHRPFHYPATNNSSTTSGAHQKARSVTPVLMIAGGGNGKRLSNPSLLGSPTSTALSSSSSSSLLSSTSTLHNDLHSLAIDGSSSNSINKGMYGVGSVEDEKNVAHLQHLLDQALDLARRTSDGAHFSSVMPPSSPASRPRDSVYELGQREKVLERLLGVAV